MARNFTEVSGGAPEVVTATISAAAQESGVVNLPGHAVALSIPSTADATTYYVQAATSPDGTFARVKNDDGTEYTVSASASAQQFVSLDAAILSGVRYLKLEAASALTTESTFEIITRRYA